MFNGLLAANKRSPGCAEEGSARNSTGGPRNGLRTKKFLYGTARNLIAAAIHSNLTHQRKVNRRIKGGTTIV